MACMIFGPPSRSLGSSRIRSPGFGYVTLGSRPLERLKMLRRSAFFIFGSLTSKTTRAAFRTLM